MKTAVITVVIEHLRFGHKISCDVQRNVRTGDYPAFLMFKVKPFDSKCAEKKS